MNKEEELIDRLIDLAFAEDIGDGDHTTLSCIPATAMGKSKLLIKEPGILAGIEVAKEVFRRFDPTMKVEVFINDGAEVKPGDIAMVVEGKVQSLLQTERLMLNIMQRMSGIATMTHKYAEKLKGTNTRVLDTRKTTPGMRILEKMAVKIGGGVNHRIGLFDMILLKDNHVDFAGGIDKAINRAKEYCKEKGKDLKIEIEVRNFDELQQVLDLGGIDRIMFDNFTPEMTKKAVDMVGGRYETESSACTRPLLFLARALRCGFRMPRHRTPPPVAPSRNRYFAAPPSPRSRDIRKAPFPSACEVHPTSNQQMRSFVRFPAAGTENADPLRSPYKTGFRCGNTPPNIR